VRSGEPCIVRSLRPRCRFFLVAQVFPTAISTRTRHLRRLPGRSCSGDRPARVRGPREGRVDCRNVRELFYDFSRSVHALRREHADERSLPRRPLDIRCRRCGAERGGVPFPTRTEPNQGLRSDGDPRRLPPSCKPGCLPPWRTVWPSDERFLPRLTPPVGPSLTPPTLFPLVGERCLHGPCKHHAAVTRDAWHSRDRRLFYQRVDLAIFRAWG